MYCGYIVELQKLRKHSNADRLQCVEVFGNNIIVDLSYKEGQRVVFFPVDGRLSDEYAEANNLVRKKDEVGNNIGGYLEPGKNNIRALKLRGEKSEGLVLPIETLSPYIDIEKLNIGDKITTLNGHLICEKYIPKRRNVTGNGNGSSKSKNISKKEKYPIFSEHVDTEQLAYNKNAFKPGDKCTITLKMHGCFTNNTRVNLWGQSKSIPISKIKPGDTVIGYKNGKFVPSKVLNTFINGTTTEWRKISISRDGLSGERASKITCTPNHLFYDKVNDIYVEAKDLIPGQKICNIKQSHILTHQHKEILLGLYLGDGYYSKRSSCGIMSISQKLSHKEYLDYIIHIFGDLFYEDPITYTSGYGTKMKRINTRYCPAIKDFFDEILSDSTENKLTEKIMPYFTDLTLAFLYMDDGSLSHNEQQRDRAYFAICDYNNHDAEIISKCINNLGYENTKFTDSRGYNRISVLTDDSQRMFNNVSKYIPLVMRYKLPIGMKNDFINFSIPCKLGYLFINNKIVSNEAYLVKKGRNKYDLHTETENYVVGGCLVHNSSTRHMSSIKSEQIKQKFFERLFHKEPKIKKEWTYVSGSRRVILEDFDGGFYGSNAFRKPWHDFFEDKLEKGETVYGEIVGYVNEQTPIMGSCSTSKFKDKEIKKLYGDKMEFSYGCKPGESKCYVYRMTLTNEDGYTVEYPDWLMRLRCEQMGIECVPLFETFYFTTWEDLMERVEKYYDGADPIGKTHVREGVVVRIENRPKFTAFKHKNFTFKLVSGLITESADTTNMADDVVEEL